MRGVTNISSSFFSLKLLLFLNIQPKYGISPKTGTFDTELNQFVADKYHLVRLFRHY